MLKNAAGGGGGRQQQRVASKHQTLHETPYIILNLTLGLWAFIGTFRSIIFLLSVLANMIYWNDMIRGKSMHCEKTGQMKKLSYFCFHYLYYYDYFLFYFSFQSINMQSGNCGGEDRRIICDS